MDIYFYNSLTRQKERFEPIKKGKVGMYSCGPTVYDHPHIGNLSAYVIWDVLKRFLISQGYKVKHVMNITDVGHLASDADEGEDKLELARKQSGKSAWQIADFFIKIFENRINRLNIIKPDKFLRATETIKEQIDFVKKLDDKGYLYKINDGMYFDTSKLDDYGQLGNLQNVQQEEGARVEKNPQKKNIADFAVWKFSPKLKQRDMEWESPWGLGFPGWHLECSVMSRMELGDTFDIHTGGVEHLTVHHPNEMAQSEAVTGKIQARYWLHNQHLRYEGGKMSKSSGTFFTLSDVMDKDFIPAAFRYFVLQNHYRKPHNFSWQSLEASQQAIKNIIRQIAHLGKKKKPSKEYMQKFYAALADDLNTSQALAVLQDVLDSDLKENEKIATVYKMDEVLGLDLENLQNHALDIPERAQIILKQREQARVEKDWSKADELREKLAKMGIEVQDSQDGQKAIQFDF